MTPRHRFQADPWKFATFQLAETLGMTVQELERRMDVTELIEWQGYWRYKAALQDQAIEQAKMQHDD